MAEEQKKANAGQYHKANGMHWKACTPGGELPALRPHNAPSCKIMAQKLATAILTRPNGKCVGIHIKMS